MEQQILIASEGYKKLDDYFTENDIKKVLLVCGNSLSALKLGEYFENLENHLGIQVVKFKEFQPNPRYESVVKGVKVFRQNHCDAIVAVGGGSAMDVAKCIKLYSNMEPDENYLRQEIIPNDIKFLAVPTTAGTGSETTRYAVIYYNGEKQSVTHESCIPTTVLMDATALKTLPDYQRKVTMLDALCHAVESYWSVNSTEESRGYSQKAIEMVMKNSVSYLANDEQGNANMLLAANIAGKAINITQTTAGHAMSYKLTSLYGIAHGHAVALCIAKLWPYMYTNMEKCIDPRGTEYLKGIFGEISIAMGCKNVEEAIEIFNKMLREYGLYRDFEAKQEDYQVLSQSVNPVRLKNNPIELDLEAIDNLYHQILAS